MKARRGVLTNLKKEPNGRSKYDSLLEKKYMQLLEGWIGVKEWTKDHGIKIPYTMFGLIRKTYYPDFLITFQDGSKELHETKGAGFLSWSSTHAKRRAAEKWCEKNGMKYKFIENSRGALFSGTTTLDDLEKRHYKREYDSLDDMLGN